MSTQAAPAAGRWPVRIRPAGIGFRTTLIDRYLVGALVGRAAPAFAVMFSVTMLERSLRLANQMAAAGAPMRFLPAMIWDLAPHYAALAMPDALLIGMLLTLAQLDEDLEIVSMLASGFSLVRLVGGLVCAAVAIGALNLAFLGWFEPLGLYGYRSIRAEAMETGWTAQAQPWAFNGRAGGVTLSADATDISGRSLSGVFLHQRTSTGGDLTLAAQAGRLGLASDGRTATLVLGAGRILSERPGEAAMSQSFRRLELADPYGVVRRPPVRGEQPQELTLPELASGPGTAPRRSELWARVARTASLLLLPFLALPLAVAARGQRRVAGMALAGLIALGSREALRLAQRLAEQGRAPPLLITAAVFGAFAVLVGWIFLSNRRLHGDRRRLPLLPKWIAPQARHPAHHSAARARSSLARYLRRELGRSILFTAAGLCALLVMIDLFERTGDVLDRGFGASGLIRFAVLRTPLLAEQSIGLATLIGAVFTFLRLGRDNEMLAIRSLGLSLAQIGRMCLPVGLVVGLATAMLAEVVSPAAQLSLAQWWRTGRTSAPDSTERWFRLGRQIVHAQSIAPDGTRLSQLVVYRRTPEGDLAGRIAAASARSGGAGSWQLAGGSGLALETASAGVRETAALAWATPMRPADLAAMLARPVQISARGALRALAGQAPTDLSRGYLLTRLNRAFAEPLAPLVMLLLALPLAPTSGRSESSGRIAIGVLGAGLLYVIGDGILTAAGQTGSAIPWLAAWAAPVVFLAFALGVLACSED